MGASMLGRRSTLALALKVDPVIGTPMTLKGKGGCHIVKILNLPCVPRRWPVFDLS